ncbi:MAG: 50S ribosomal protein L1 [Chloroflexi bacterium]|nr:50S ribosomal protein L1 [Chloroflexota bacterium]MCH8225185.1 50S ribosomal protein L1 [Chloroflexota bacterium]MCI0846177.1 50S ribosomal protein L1 [Chloroflexota bacterium]
MVKHSRRYKVAAQEVDRDKFYQPEEAIGRLKELSTTKFDETVEIHLRTNADPRHADQMVRGVAVLPHGLGKTVRVLVFAGADAAEAARQAGADFVGEDDLIEQIEGGWTDFDLGLAVPAVMPKIGKLGRILGRKGLMPNPRSGTMVQPQDLPRVIQEAKGGRIEYRTDRTAIIHGSVGKISFETEQLMENLASLTSAIMRDRPTAIKGSFIRSAYLTSSMGPSIPLELASLQSLEAPE